MLLLLLLRLLLPLTRLLLSGNMGYVNVEKGKNALLLESSCSWATPKAWTETNKACEEGGENCDEHLPPPPPTFCTKYCTPANQAVCAQLGMHCTCGGKVSGKKGESCVGKFKSCDTKCK